MKTRHINLLKPLRKTFRLFKHEISFFFSLFWGPILACLEPDPDSRFGFADPIESRSGHETLCWMDPGLMLLDVSGRTVTGTEMAGLGYINGLFLAGRLMEETFPRIRDEHPHTLHLFHCFFLSVSY
jgi:hypothetical protein